MFHSLAEKIILGAAILAACAAVYPGKQKQIQGFGENNILYKAEVLQQIRRSQRIDGAVVFLGDSEITGLASSNIALKTENFGISGETIEGLIGRVPSYKLDKARAIVIEIGINNMAIDRLSGFSDKYSRLLALMPPAVPVIAMAIMPVNPDAAQYFIYPGAESSIQAANRGLREACLVRPNTQYLDVHDPLADPSSALRQGFSAGDGLHLSEAGYAVIEQLLTSALN